MKKIFLLFLVLPFFFLACGDDKKNDKDSPKEKEETQTLNSESDFYSGKVVILYNNGNIKYVENFRNGIKEGEYLNCYQKNNKELLLFQNIYLF